MVISSIGYLFEGRRDVGGGVGLVEKYVQSGKVNARNVKLVCGIDMGGAMVKPAYEDLGHGFLPLSARLTQGSLVEDVERFIKSNKPFYNKFGEFAMIADISVDFYPDDTSYSINLYTPKFVTYDISLDRGKGVTEGDTPVIVCDLIDDRDGVNVFAVDKDILRGYRSKIMSLVTSENTESKLRYLLMRVS